MPINRKRRIFRSEGLPAIALGRPPRGLTLTVLAGVLVVIGGSWLALRPSEAPAVPPPPGRISAGPAEVRVIDGATLMLRDQTVQLEGVQATERGVACLGANGTQVDCGVAAANALADLVHDAVVDCALAGPGRGGRPLAVCSAGGAELNLAMIASGWARTEPGAAGLRSAEDKARASRRGIWADTGGR